MNPNDDYDPGKLFIGNPPWKGRPMQPINEGPHTTEHPMGNAGDDFDTRERRLKAFAKKYLSQASAFADAGFAEGGWVDDNGSFYSLLAPTDVEATFFDINTLIAELATDPDTPANPIELSKREFAAITMRVPQSGIEWLDDMIREANRRDMMQVAMSRLRIMGDDNNVENDTDATARWALAVADALLAALAKEKNDGTE